jgi:acetyltransferase-like isoleucine patch superfamily enzyme
MTRILLKFLWEETRRVWVSARLARKYQSCIHPTCFIDDPAKVLLGKGVRIGRHVHIRCPGDSRVQIGANSLINSFSVLRADLGRIELGENVSLQYHSVIYGTGGVVIGNNTRISSQVLILATVHHYESTERPIVEQGISGRGIQIGSDVWIGAGAIILDGVTIGDGAVIGAGSVVAKNVPPLNVQVGNPARVVKLRRHRMPPSILPEAMDSILAQ